MTETVSAAPHIRVRDQDIETGMDCRSCARRYGVLHTEDCPERLTPLLPDPPIFYQSWSHYTCPDCSNPPETCFCEILENNPYGRPE